MFSSPLSLCPLQSLLSLTVPLSLLCLPVSVVLNAPHPHHAEASEWSVLGVVLQGRSIQDVQTCLIPPPLPASLYLFPPSYPTP